MRLHFFKIKGKTNAEDSGLCLHNISPLLETTYRTNQNLDKAYSDRFFSQNDPRIRNVGKEKKVMSVEFSSSQINGISHIAWIILNHCKVCKDSAEQC